MYEIRTKMTLFCGTEISRTHKKSPRSNDRRDLNRNLAVTYSHMGRPHTTIGAGRLHFRVRNGIGWFPSAMAARQTG